ncbi:MAG TPA: threonine synthase, partial [Flavisolibacter sp.]|nr:threonine synthase [Flavisolibacter sp.]
VLPKGFIDDIENYSKEEIALQVIRPYVGDVIPLKELEKIVTETINFDFPLKHVSDNISSLELYHGPTLAFKDVGARFMSRCLRYFVRNEKKELTVLVATSGDTGGAVADGFYNVDGVNVVILYPANKVSSIQELQLTTHGKNIKAISVEGSFDDCQNMVKQAFADEELNKNIFLTSANSINVARWLPQQFYFFYAWKQWEDKKNPPVVSVPSGNFGNICAGLMAQASGLPILHFIAACNANSAVSEYLQTGKYAGKPVIPTMSNAMDVGNPSNFVRILEIFDQQYNNVKNELTAFNISDELTRQVIGEVFEKENYLLDPHGAVAYISLKEYLSNHPTQLGYFLETAHPVKFYDVVEPVINSKIEIPDAVKKLFSKKKTSVKMKPEYALLKEFLYK